MAVFRESNMTFNFADDSFYHIEKSSLLSQLEGFATCECVVKLQDKVTLIEAKSSTPNPKNENDFDEFIYDIMSKFRDTMAFYNAVLLRHDKEIIGSELKTVDLKSVDYRLICKFPWHERPSLTKDGQNLYSDYPIKRPTYPFRSMLCNMNE